MVYESGSVQTVNIEGIQKEDFQELFTSLLNFGFSMNVTIVGEVYKIEATKYTPHNTPTIGSGSWEFSIDPNAPITVSTNTSDVPSEESSEGKEYYERL